MTDDTPQEKQDNEVEALKAIFGQDLVDQRDQTVWQTWKPLDVLLTLFPQQGSSGNQEIHCMVVLHVICPNRYPDIEPELKIERSKGLSDIQLQSLLGELRNLSMSLIGEVMIFELAQHIQTFLHINNKPGTKSFYEEMVIAQKQKEQIKLRDKQVKEDKERQELNDQILKCQEILKWEVRLNKEPRFGLLQEMPDELSNAHPIMNIERNRTYSQRIQQLSISESSEGSSCEHRGLKIIPFSFKGDRNVTRGRCLGHSERGSVVYAGLDTTSGELLMLIEWSIAFQTSNRSSPQKQSVNKNKGSPNHFNLSQYDLTTLMRHITSIEQELSFLIKLHHQNLVHYLNIKYQYENNCLVVYLLQEFVLGGSISCLYLNDGICMEVDTLRHFASGLLEGINYLHSNNVVHKDVRETNVFIDRSGTVRLADFSLDKRLMELYQSGDLNIRYSKRQDILRIGILFISLLQGELITNDQVKIPINLPQDLKDFLSKCVDKNERTRWSSEQLLNHQFIKTPMSRLLPQRDVDDKSDTGSVNGNGDGSDAVDIESFIPAGASGQSRIKNEFEILKWLGKGAFGDVLKVRNKLDGGSYAIKRIQLNPKNIQLNKKITREVKLLSRLNHENVVRYYNSWIESATIEQKEDSSNISTTVATENNEDDTIDKSSFLSFGNHKDIEKLAPKLGVEWSVSYSSHSKPPHTAAEDVSFRVESSSSEDDDDEDDDDIDAWKNFLSEINMESNSDSIEFKNDDTINSVKNTYDTSEDCNEIDQVDSRTENGMEVYQIQYLYIQMEFCEKSTLRNAIDNELYLNTERMWRLFREIVEGLSHIHQQGMIHRDLKPVNIFLDSNDHVKIGDFGLATNILPKTTQAIIEIQSNREIESYSQDLIGDGSLTGHVGTALYVAPELMTTGNKAIYNQKVDIYSLGIILFEMSYMPLKTGMERVKVLGNLRLKDIVIPESFLTSGNSKQISLIRWLLNHDGSTRPTCSELLECDLLPSVFEEYELREVLRHALSSKQSKGYYHLINACFQQKTTPAENITYDMNIIKTVASHNRQPLLMMNFVKETVIKIFKIHGGMELTTPLMLPLCHLYDSVESSVRLMTHGGSIVHIPHDLRVPFARYVACNGITNMKRYCIERVYREKQFYGFHPRELYECSFDIVTPTQGSLFADAELLSIMYEIVNEFQAMKYKNIAIRLNHTSLLKAVMMSCGIDDHKFKDLYSILWDKKLSKFQIKTHLISLCLSDQEMVTLFNLMETECTIDKLSHILKPVLRKKGEINTLAKEGIKDLETIVHNAESLGVKCPLLISPCMVYNIHQYSGMMCQFMCELKKKRRRADLDVIAAGGRYDNMISNFRNNLRDSNDVSIQAAVGISLSLERLIQGAMGGDDDIYYSECDVYVCTTSSSKLALKERAHVASMLWNSGIKTNLMDTTNVNEIQEICREFDKAHMIIIADSEQGTVRIRSWDKDRFQERKVCVSELIDNMQRILTDSSTSNNCALHPQIIKSESKVSFNDTERQSSSLPNVSVNFIASEKSEKLTASTRRRYETQIKSQMSGVLQLLSPKCVVNVLAITLDSGVIRSLVSYLDIEAQQNVFDKSVRAVIEKHPRHKKYLSEICDEIRFLALEKNKSAIALYSIQDSMFKMFI